MSLVARVPDPLVEVPEKTHDLTQGLGLWYVSESAGGG